MEGSIYITKGGTMTLNSLDVQNKTFNPQWRGFNKHEVDEFLDIVVRDYDEFAQKLKDQDRELKTLRERVKYFDEMKDSLNKSIVVAQDAADNLKAQAEKEADSLMTDAHAKSQSSIADAATKGQLIIEAAKKEASLILNAASDDAREMVRNTDDLKRTMRIYHQRMNSMIENQLVQIKSEDWEEVLKPASSDYLINPEEKLQEILESTTQANEGEGVTDEDANVETEVEAKELAETSEVEADAEVEADTEITAMPEAVSEAKSFNHETTEEPVEHNSEDDNEEPDVTVEHVEHHSSEIFPELEENPGSVEKTVNETLPDESETTSESHE